MTEAIPGCPPADDALDGWRALLARRASFRETLAPCEPLLQAWAAWRSDAIQPSWRVEECRHAWGKGEPLLSRAQPRVANAELEPVLGPALDGLAAKVVEGWEALHTPDVAWLGDPELRRIAYQRGGAIPTRGLFWVGESAKAALDRVGAPLPHLLAIPEASVPVYYGPWLRETESLPSEESLKARVLSARGVAVTWATYDHTGARLEYQPTGPLDTVFYLRRAGTRAVHAWRLFRSRGEAVRYAAETLARDEDAGRWAASIPSEDFDDLVRKFGVGPPA